MTYHRIGLIGVAGMLLVGCGNDSLPSAASGEELFGHYCAECHHSDGSGSFLEGVPANRNTRMNEQQVVELILYGHEDTSMPVFKQLEPLQAELIAQHLLGELHQ